MTLDDHWRAQRLARREGVRGTIMSPRAFRIALVVALHFRPILIGPMSNGEAARAMNAGGFLTFHGDLWTADKVRHFRAKLSPLMRKSISGPV